MKNVINSSMKEEKKRKKRLLYPSRKHSSVVFNNTAKAALLRVCMKGKVGNYFFKAYCELIEVEPAPSGTRLR